MSLSDLRVSPFETFKYSSRNFVGSFLGTFFFFFGVCLERSSASVDTSRSLQRTSGVSFSGL